jgi:uncharacterized protein (DUF488 family)
MNRELTIWTIGHSTRPIDELLGLLAENQVEAIADVRSHPGSRRNPQYGQDALRDELRQEALSYHWLSALGGRRRARADSLNTIWRNLSFRGYADYMQTPQFTDGLEELLLLASDKRTSLMCSEAVWWRCHRSMIADALKARGVRVLHIMGANSVVEHPYTAPARIRHGQLTYAGEEPSRE